MGREQRTQIGRTDIERIAVSGDSGGGTGIAVGHTEPPTLVIYKTVKGDTALRTEVEPR